MDLYRLGCGVNDPVLFNSKTRVSLELDSPVALRGCGREDFHCQVRRATDSVLDNLRPFVKHEKQVGLEHIVITENDVERRDKHFAHRVAFEKVA